MTIQITGLSDIIEHYDVFLIDQFGVLHDGVNPYPSTLDTLTRLKSAGKTLVIVSNSGKRSALNVERMNTLGIDRSLYDDFVTSGDVAHEYLKKHLLGNQNQACFLISRDGDSSAITGLDVALTGDPNQADLIIISGSEGDRFEESHYRALLATSASNKIVCLCTNPDKKMLTPNGLKFGAGRIAEIYEEQGGDVLWIGKPHQSIYSHIFDLIPQLDKQRTLCIGDSIEHDIAGGKHSDIRTLLVRTGIVSGVTLGELMNQFDQYGVVPDYLVDEFRI